MAPIKSGWLLWADFPAVRTDGTPREGNGANIASLIEGWKRHWAVLHDNRLDLYLGVDNGSCQKVTTIPLSHQLTVHSNHTCCVTGLEFMGDRPRQTLMNNNSISPSSSLLPGSRPPSPKSAMISGKAPSSSVTNASNRRNNPDVNNSTSTTASTLNNRYYYYYSTSNQLFRFDLSAGADSTIFHHHSFLTHSFVDLMEWIGVLNRTIGNKTLEYQRDSERITTPQYFDFNISASSIFPETISNALARNLMRGNLSYYDRNSARWQDCKGLLTRDNFHVVLNYQQSHSTLIIPMDPFAVNISAVESPAYLPVPLPPDSLRTFVFEFKFVSSKTAAGTVYLATDLESVMKQWLGAIKDVLGKNLISGIEQPERRIMMNFYSVDERPILLPEFVKMTPLVKRQSIRNNLMLLNRSKIGGGNDKSPPKISTMGLPSPPASKPSSRVPSGQFGNNNISTLLAPKGSSESDETSKLPSPISPVRSGTILRRAIQLANNNRKSLAIWFSNTSAASSQ